MPTSSSPGKLIRQVIVPVEDRSLEGLLSIPSGVEGLVIVAQGIGASRHSPRSRAVAATFQEAGLATLLLDLLTTEEWIVDRMTGRLRFDISLLTDRLVAAIDWAARNPDTKGFRIGCFGADTAAAAALAAAAIRPHLVRAVVSQGGRPELAEPWLCGVRAPALMIVGGQDEEVLRLYRRARSLISAPACRLHVIPRAIHLFDELEPLEEAARQSAEWFSERLLRAETARAA